MKIVHVALAVLVLASAASNAAAERPVTARAEGLSATVVAPPAAPPPGSNGALAIVVRCQDCVSEAPTIGLLWNVADASRPEQRRVLVATDWAAGRFTLSGDGGGEIQGQPTADGWIVDVPLLGQGLPFRVTGVLPGFVAAKAAYWPAQEQGSAIVFEMSPVEAVMEANPAWNPARTGECEILVPKSAELPIVIMAGNQPRAWLFPRIESTTGGDVDDASGDAWTFQFVRPGACLLERVSVTVPAFDEGDSWAFRLPLDGVLPAPATRRLPGDAAANLALADGRELGSAQRLVTVGGAGIVDLADCPRVVR